MRLNNIIGKQPAHGMTCKLSKRTISELHMNSQFNSQLITDPLSLMKQRKSCLMRKLMGGRLSHGQ